MFFSILGDQGPQGIAGVLGETRKNLIFFNS